jgi:hypothetical protein
MILPASYNNGFAPRDGMPLYPELWRGCVGAWNPGLGPTGLTLRDWSGRGNHGTLTNMDPGTDLVATDKSYALDFDGSNDYVDMGASGSALINSLPFFVSAWIKPVNVSGGTSGFQGVVCSDQSGGPMFFRLRSGAIQFSYDENAVSFVAGGTVANGSWQHIAGMADGSTYKVYLNGSLVGSKTAAVSPITSANKLVLGVDFTFVSGRNFNGQMLDVRIYHRVVSENEIRILASRRGIAYEMAPRRRSSSAVQFNRRRRLLLGST